jgi:hypothetical protein
VIIIKGLFLPKIGGIALFPFILLREKTPSETLVHHERIHIRQQLELLVIPFYIWYALEWLVHFIRVKDFWEAYRLISFEKEAYTQEADLAYLKNRPVWAFLYYL